MDEEPCQYRKLCSHYGPECVYEEHVETCWVYNAFESIINKQIFKSRIWKRMMRDEHGHGWEVG